MLELRTFRPADGEALISWFPTEASLQDFAGPGIRWPLDTEQLDARLGTPGLLAWTANRPPSTDPIGHIELLHTGPHQARIDRVALSRERRGQGLAAELVRLALVHARELDVHAVDLLVFAGNAPAVRTYLSVGFADVGAIAPEYPTVRRMSLALT